VIKPNGVPIDFNARDVKQCWPKIIWNKLGISYNGG